MLVKGEFKGVINFLGQIKVLAGLWVYLKRVLDKIDWGRIFLDDN